MKKVNLLTKAEMKNVLGGLNTTNCMAISLSDGSSTGFVCNGSVSACQETASANCAARPDCAVAICS